MSGQVWASGGTGLLVLSQEDRSRAAVGLVSAASLHRLHSKHPQHRGPGKQLCPLVTQSALLPLAEARRLLGWVCPLQARVRPEDCPSCCPTE